MKGQVVSESLPIRHGSTFPAWIIFGNNRNRHADLDNFSFLR